MATTEVTSKQRERTLNMMADSELEERQKGKRARARRKRACEVGPKTRSVKQGCHQPKVTGEGERGRGV